MFTQFNMARFVDIFIEETRETMQKIEKLLLSIEQNRTIESEEVHDLFRYIHTLKGNSSSIGYTYFSKLAHEMESFLDAMRHERIDYSASVAELLIRGYDLLCEILELEIGKAVDQRVFRGKCFSFIQELGGYENADVVKSKAKPEGAFASGEGVSFGFFGGFAPLQQPEAAEAASVDTVLPATQEKEPSKELRSITSASIRINLDKIDNLMNDIGELVIAMSMMEQYTQSLEDPKIKAGFNERISFLRHTIRDLQNSVMSTRMVPMEQVYSKFPKLVRDIAKKLGKEIVVETGGDEVEIDRAMIEGLTDPLMHIIRNACDHGIEPAEERIKKGKPREGKIRLDATQANEQIMITVSDDGHGIDSGRVVEKAVAKGMITKGRAESMSVIEKLDLIFEPGLSTAADVTDLSGRGVGMDVVRSNINRLGGSIRIESIPGEGTTLTLLLPLTLAIVDVLNVAIGESRFFLPLAMIIESLQPEAAMIQSLGNRRNEVLILREEAIPVIRLHAIFNLPTEVTSLERGMLIIVRYGTSKVALFIDMFLNQQQVVIKPIDKNFKAIEGFSGATIKGDGSIGLILDVAAIAVMHKRNKGLS